MFRLHFGGFVTLILVVNYVKCGVLILPPKQFDAPSLKPFNEDTFDLLKSSFKKAKIFSFQVNSDKIPIDCKSLLSSTNGQFSSYIPNVEYIPENVVLVDDCTTIKKQLDSFKDKIVLIININKETSKVKRNVDEEPPTNPTIITSTSTSTSTSTISSISTTEENTIKNSKYISPDEPVVYYPPGDSLQMEKKALLYSGRAPLLKVNDTSYILGAGKVVTVDERDNYIRMSCTIPVEGGKITLRFRFPKENGYWYLTFVEVVFQDVRSFNLTITKKVSAPMGFSYCCGGETVFSDASGTTSLTLYDLQVQPRVASRTFSPAYNCVPFMTGPIWSGIFVSSLLCIGLIVGLSALGSIKTMDKFDNSKTKQLSITIMGE